jgi:hypothetical protein
MTALIIEGRVKIAGSFPQLEDELLRGHREIAEFARCFRLDVD